MPLTTSPETPIPVRQAVSLIGQWVDRLGVVWVEGQVTQISRRGGMGTVFLVLRDKLADVSMTLTAPRGVVDSLPTPLVEGAQIVVHAKPNVYPNRGTLSLQVREIRLVGEGELLARLERRRRLLAAEGLFAAELKRPLPFLPCRIGLITAQDSAAERDVVEVSRRRWPGVELEIRYAAMQGVNSVEQVIEALRRLDADERVEVIVIARGGGSTEDLLPFSDETLVRAVHAARTPVVSAIGHEPDSPILDLVADLRAATPTDAAKSVVPDVAEETRRLAEVRRRLRGSIRQRLAWERQQLDALLARPSLADPRAGLAGRTEEVDQLRDRARRVLRHALDRAEDDLGHQLARVRALSPLATLQRGYAVVSDGEGRHVAGIAGLESGAVLNVRLADGRVETAVRAVHDQPLPSLGNEPTTDPHAESESDDD